MSSELRSARPASPGMCVAACRHTPNQREHDMADNTKNPTNPDQRQRDSNKPPKGAPEKPVGNVGNVGNRDVGGDPNKSKLPPDADQDRGRQGQSGVGSP